MLPLILAATASSSPIDCREYYSSMLETYKTKKVKYAEWKEDKALVLKGIKKEWRLVFSPYPPPASYDRWNVRDLGKCKVDGNEMYIYFLDPKDII